MMASKFIYLNLSDPEVTPPPPKTKSDACDECKSSAPIGHAAHKRRFVRATPSSVEFYHRLNKGRNRVHVRLVRPRCEQNALIL